MVVSCSITRGISERMNTRTSSANPHSISASSGSTVSVRAALPSGVSGAGCSDGRLVPDASASLWAPAPGRSPSACMGAAVVPSVAKSASSLAATRKASETAVSACAAASVARGLEDAAPAAVRACLAVAALALAAAAPDEDFPAATRAVMLASALPDAREQGESVDKRWRSTWTGRNRVTRVHACHASTVPHTCGNTSARPAPVIPRRLSLPACAAPQPAATPHAARCYLQSAVRACATEVRRRRRSRPA